MGNEKAQSPAVQVQSVDRALAILDILAVRGEAGVTEIAAELDVHKSTAFRLIGALESRRLVEQVAERGKYRLGFGITAEELEIGLNAVAAPVRDGSGDVIASVSVSGPAYRLTVDSFADVAEKLCAGAAEISSRIGYFGQ